MLKVQKGNMSTNQQIYLNKKAFRANDENGTCDNHSSVIDVFLFIGKLLASGFFDAGNAIFKWSNMPSVASSEPVIQSQFTTNMHAYYSCLAVGNMLRFLHIAFVTSFFAKLLIVLLNKVRIYIQIYY